MTQSKHTEGPWDINAFDLAQVIKIKSGPDSNGVTYTDGRHLETVAHVGFDGQDWETRRANTRLICAAPDMLAALEAWDRLQEIGSMSPPNKVTGNKKLLSEYENLKIEWPKLARAALIKARGQ